MASNRVIGNGPNIPWKNKEDFQHFKETTLGHTLVMGSTTFNSIGKPLPGRTTLILNFLTNFPSQGCEVFTNYLDIVEKYKDSQEIVYICGGASIYNLFLPFTDELIISIIPGEYVGDVYFPAFADKFILVKEEEKETFILRRYKRV
jgi:dihydrofolate reductase